MKFLLVVLAFLFLLPSQVQAVANPLAVPNNRFGIHILDENDLMDAAHMLNSNGGDWGYVTLVIRQDELDLNKWQKTFDQLRRLHLIPILRLATIQTKNDWQAPKPEDAADWAEFLNSLNWVIQNRYVVLFNEPNHAKEWGGKIAPAEYSEVVSEFSRQLKAKSPDFFILSAGLDMSAPNATSTMDAFNFYQKMYLADSEVFGHFDGLATHSYPNPGFRGSVADTGKKSIVGFVDEINYLGQFGVDADIPLFITETGWINDQDIDVAQNYKDAFSGPWKRSNIVAVTPFILNYTQPPFEQFSFKKRSGEYNLWYKTIADIPKVAGMPAQLDSMEVIDAQLPDSLILDSSYLLTLKIKNTGQKIWETGQKSFSASISPQSAKISIDEILKTEPGQETLVNINLKTPFVGKSINVDLGFVNKEIKLIPPTTLTLHSTLAFKLKQTFTVDLLIYDANRLLKKVEDVLVSDSLAQIKDLHDVIPGKTYRFVITKPFYLPTQALQLIEPNDTKVSFDSLLPVDFNADGDLNINDLLAFLINPEISLGRFFPLDF